MLKKIKKILSPVRKIVLPFFSLFFLLALPASTSYRLKDFGFGNGGTGGASSTDYKMSAIAGELSGGKMSSANYKVGSGLIFTNQVNVPDVPTFDNPNNYYNKLRIVIAAAGNPSDTKFAIAISKDNFVTTQYVQNDNTVGIVLGIEDYQSYATWGSAGGTLIIGLTANTTYKVKVKAMQGKFTETDYSATATAATIAPTLSFGVSPNTINFGSIIPTSIVDSPQNITASFSTNGESGGRVYIFATNAGLYSIITSHKINAISADLSSQLEGYGAQSVSVSQTSGGPLAAVSPYNQSGNIVGITDTSIREIFSTPGPIVGGSGVFLLKAKASAITPAATDYKEILTVIAAGSF